MFRVYRGMITTAYYALTYIKLQGLGDRHLKNYLSAWCTNPDPGMTVDTEATMREKDLMVTLLGGANQDLMANSIEHTQTTFGRVLKSFYDNRRGQEDDDASLIEMLVRIVKLPFAGNFMSGVRIKQLAEAFLLPDEMQKVVTKLRTMELSCGECGQKLHNGEMVSLHMRTDDGPMVPPRLVCHRCVAPRVVGCEHCENAVPLPEGVQKKFARQRFYCKTHETPEGRAAAAPPAIREVTDLTGQGAADRIPPPPDLNAIYTIPLPRQPHAFRIPTAPQVIQWIDEVGTLTDTQTQTMRDMLRADGRDRRGGQ